MDSTRRLPLLLLLLVLAGAGLTAVLVRAAAPEPPPAAPPVVLTPPVALTALPFATPLTEALTGAVRQIRVDEAARRERLRRAEATRLARSRTPEAVVRRAWLLHRTSRDAYDAQRRVLWRARAVARTLDGARGAEMRAALGVVDALAARRLLTSDRLRAVLVTLQRNTDWWSRRAAPPYGRSIMRGQDPITLKYVPGQGLVLHQLASWGRVNWLAGFCLRRPKGCPRRRLRRDVDALMGLSVRRDGVVRAESYFRFGWASAPWLSAMTQGTMIDALTRAWKVLGDDADRRRAQAALGVFRHRAPEGVAVPADGGTHFLMYSTEPGLRVLNGHLQALTGLRDLAVLGGSRRALALYRSGEGAARVQLRRDDTGAWSRYSDGGAESTVAYHELVTGFLANLCDRGAGRRYCRASARFARYLHEPTRIAVRCARRPRARRATGLTVWISKRSSVRLTVLDVGGHVVARRAAAYARGSHRFTWAAPHRGRYTVQVTAAGPGDPPLGREAVGLTVLPTPAHPPKRPLLARR